MRMLGFLFATLVAAYLNPTYVQAQGSEERRAEEQIEPYRKHQDTRHGHNHDYPDRGAIVRDLPRGTIGLNYAGVSYRFHDGVWFEPRGPAFLVVEPPIGLVVPTLPSFATLVGRGEETYLYANGIYYQSRPELGGYEVVNDPGEVTPLSAPGSVVGAAPPGEPLAPPTATALLATSPVAVGPPAPTPAPMTAPALAASAPATIPAAASAASLAASAPPAIPAAASAPASVASVASAPMTIPAAAPAPSLAASAPTAIPAAASAASMPAPTLAASVSTPIPATSLPTSAAAPTTLTAGPSSLPPSAVQLGPKVFVYPKTGQSPDQQAHDRYDCYRFAVAQSGSDPMHSSGSAPRADQMSDYERAQAACLEGRGYSVR